MAENITLNNVATFQNDTSAVNVVNNNNSAIVNAFADVLSRSGIGPNQMSAPLDMNNNQIINLPFPTTANSPARLADISGGTVTIVTATTGTSGHTVPFLDGANTWSNTQTFNNGLIESFTPAGFTSSNTFNSFSVGVDNLDASGVGNLATAYNFYHNFGGSVLKGSRQALTVVGQLTSPTSASNTSRFYVGGSFTCQAVSSDGGGVGTEKGSIFGGNSIGILNAAATNMGELCGHEFNTTAIAGSTVLDKWGISVVQTANDAVSGSRNDASIRLVNQSGAVGWNRGIQFGDGLNQFPVKTSGTLIKTVSGSITNGVDFSASTFSGSAFASPSFSVNGSGLITTGSNGLNNGSMIFNGATSGFISLVSNTTGNLLTVSQPMAIGTAGTVGGSLTFNGLTSGSAVINVSSTAGTLQMGGGNFTIDSSGNVITNGTLRTSATTGLPPGGAAVYTFTNAVVGIYVGTGNPTASAAKGSIYLENGVGQLWLNTSGSTTWTQVTVP